MCGKSDAVDRPVAGPRYYKRVRHLAVIISAALLSVGAADFHAATPPVSPSALPLSAAWTREFAGAPPTTAAVAGSGWIVAGFPDHIEFIALDSGERVGSLPVPGTHLACGPTLCVAGDDSLIRAVDVAARTVRWQRPAPAALAATPVLRNGWVFLVTADGHVAALRETDGSTVWTHAAGAALTGPVSVDGDRVALATAQGDVQVIDVAAGRVIWTRAIEGGRR